MKSDKIESIIYTERYFDPAESRITQRTRYELLPDGTIKIRHYKDRECVSRDINNEMDADDFIALCTNINRCIKNANTCVQYIDGRSAEVIIHRAFGRREIMDRGLGTKDCTVGSYIERYIQHALHPEDEVSYIEEDENGSVYMTQYDHDRYSGSPELSDEEVKKRLEHINSMIGVGDDKIRAVKTENPQPVPERKSIHDWCVELGVNPIPVYEAIAEGMTLKEALKHCGAEIDENEEYWRV